MASLFHNYSDLFSEGAHTKMIFLLSFLHILPPLNGKIAHI